MSNYETINGQTFLKVRNYFFDLLPNEIIDLIEKFKEIEPSEEHNNFYKNDLKKHLFNTMTIKQCFNNPNNLRFLNNNLIIMDERKFYFEYLNKDELKEKLSEYVKENIYMIYSGIDYYNRCLKDEFYKYNDFREGMKKKTIKNLNKYIKEGNGKEIFEMLDFEVFIYNFGRFNEIEELLNGGLLFQLDEAKYIYIQDY
jgi:hypothetical protein